MQATGLTVGDTARLLGVSTSTVKLWTEQGKLACSRTDSGHRRYDPTEVSRLVSERSGGSQEAS